MKNTFFISFFIIATITLSHSKAQVADDASSISPLLTGEYIPEEGRLTQLDGEIISLKTISARKNTVLIFFRGGWCPYCNRQLSGLQNIEEDLKKLGYQMIAISPDEAEDLEKTVDKNELTYEIYTDPNAQLATQFGIAFKLDEKTLKKYKHYGIDTSNSNDILPVPSIFIINKEGKIIYEYINPDYKERLDEKLLLRNAEHLSK